MSLTYHVLGAPCGVKMLLDSCTKPPVGEFLLPLAGKGFPRGFELLRAGRTVVDQDTVPPDRFSFGRRRIPGLIKVKTGIMNGQS